MSPTSAPVATITEQTRGWGRDPNGQPSQGYEVAYTTTKGQKGTVFVADSQYTTANVKAAVKAAATTVDELHGAEV